MFPIIRASWSVGRIGYLMCTHAFSSIINIRSLFSGKREVDDPHFPFIAVLQKIRSRMPGKKNLFIDTEVTSTKAKVRNDSRNEYYLLVITPIDVISLERWTRMFSATYCATHSRHILCKCFTSLCAQMANNSKINAEIFVSALSTSCSI